MAAQPKYSFCQINESAQTAEQAAELLLAAFSNSGMWTDINEKEAIDTVAECIEDGNICIGIKAEDKLIGWAGARQMYEKT